MLPTTMTDFQELEVRRYMLSANTDDGFIQFYFKERPPRPNYDDDGPLEVRIPNDCWIKFVLDPALRWRFRHDFTNLPPVSYGNALTRAAAEDDCGCDPGNEAITLGDNCCQALYSDLRHISSQEVMFFARYCDDRYKCECEEEQRKRDEKRGRKHADPESGDTYPRPLDDFNIYVELEQMSAETISGKKVHYPKVLEIRIDPDMQNPGDDTSGGSTKNLELQLKDATLRLNQAEEEIVRVRKALRLQR